MDFERYSAARLRLDQLVLAQNIALGSTTDPYSQPEWLSSSHDQQSFHPSLSPLSPRTTATTPDTSKDEERRARMQRLYAQGHLTTNIQFTPLSLSERLANERQVLSRSMFGARALPLAPRYKEDEGLYVPPQADIPPWQVYKLASRLAREDPDLSFFFTADGHMALAPRLSGKSDVRNYGIPEEWEDEDSRTNTIIMQPEKQENVPTFRSLCINIPNIRLIDHENATIEDILTFKLTEEYERWNRCGYDDRIAAMDGIIVQLQAQAGEALLKLEDALHKVKHANEEAEIAENAAKMLGKRSSTILDSPEKIALMSSRNDCMSVIRTCMDILLKLRETRVAKDEVCKHRQQHFVTMYTMWQRIKAYRERVPVIAVDGGVGGVGAGVAGLGSVAGRDALGYDGAGDVTARGKGTGAGMTYAGTSLVMRVRRIPVDANVEAEEWKAAEAGELAEAAKLNELAALLLDLERPCPRRVSLHEVLVEWARDQIRIWASGILGISGILRGKSGTLENFRNLAEEWIDQFVKLVGRQVCGSADNVVSNIDNMYNSVDNVRGLGVDGLHDTNIHIDLALAANALSQITIPPLVWENEVYRPEISEILTLLNKLVIHNGKCMVEETKRARKRAFDSNKEFSQIRTRMMACRKLPGKPLYEPLIENSGSVTPDDFCDWQERKRRDALRGTTYYAVLRMNGKEITRSESVQMEFPDYKIPIGVNVLAHVTQIPQNLTISLRRNNLIGSTLISEVIIPVPGLMSPAYVKRLVFSGRRFDSNTAYSISHVRGHGGVLLEPQPYRGAMGMSASSAGGSGGGGTIVGGMNNSGVSLAGGNDMDAGLLTSRNSSIQNTVTRANEDIRDTVAFTVDKSRYFEGDCVCLCYWRAKKSLQQQQQLPRDGDVDLGERGDEALAGGTSNGSYTANNSHYTASWDSMEGGLGDEEITPDLLVQLLQEEENSQSGKRRNKKKFNSGLSDPNHPYYTGVPDQNWESDFPDFENTGVFDAHDIPPELLLLDAKYHVSSRRKQALRSRYIRTLGQVASSLGPSDAVPLDEEQVLLHAGISENSGIFTGIRGKIGFGGIHSVQSLATLQKGANDGNRGMANTPENPDLNAFSRSLALSENRNLQANMLTVVSNSESRNYTVQPGKTSNSDRDREKRDERSRLLALSSLLLQRDNAYLNASYGLQRDTDVITHTNIGINTHTRADASAQAQSQVFPRTHASVRRDNASMQQDDNNSNTASSSSSAAASTAPYMASGPSAVGLHALALLLSNGDTLLASELTRSLASTPTRQHANNKEITHVSQVVREYVDPDFQPFSQILSTLFRAPRPLFVYRLPGLARNLVDSTQTVLALQVVRGINLPIRSSAIPIAVPAAARHLEVQRLWTGTGAGMGVNMTPSAGMGPGVGAGATSSPYYNLLSDPSPSLLNCIVRVQCGSSVLYSPPSPGAHPQWNYALQLPVDMHVAENTLTITVFDVCEAREHGGYKLVYIGEVRYDINALKYANNTISGATGVHVILPLHIPLLHTQVTPLLPQIHPQIELFLTLSPAVLAPPIVLPPDSVLSAPMRTLAHAAQKVSLSFTPYRPLSPFVQDYLGQYKLLCHYLAPTPPPPLCQAHPRLFTRFSGICTFPNPEDDTILPFTDSIRLGADANEATIALCNYWLWWENQIGKNALSQNSEISGWNTYLGVGMCRDGSRGMCVVRIHGHGTPAHTTRSHANNVNAGNAVAMAHSQYDSAVVMLSHTGEEWSPVKDAAACHMTRLYLLVDRTGVWANIQAVCEPQHMHWDLTNSGDWRVLHHEPRALTHGSGVDAGAGAGMGTASTATSSLPSTFSTFHSPGIQSSYNDALALWHGDLGHWDISAKIESEILRHFTSACAFVPRVDYGVCSLLRKCLTECEKLAANVHGVTDVMRNSLEVIKGAYKNVVGIAVDVPLHLSMVDADDEGGYDEEYISSGISDNSQFPDAHAYSSGSSGNGSGSGRNMDALSYAVSTSSALHGKIWQQVRSTLLHTSVGRESKLAVAAYVNAYTRYNAVAWVFIAVLDEY